MNKRNILLICIISMILTGCNSKRPSSSSEEMSSDENIEYATNKNGEYETDENGYYVIAETEASTLVISIDPNKDTQYLTKNIYKVDSSLITDKVMGYISLYNDETDILVAMPIGYAKLLYEYSDQIYVSLNIKEYPYQDIISKIYSITYNLSLNEDISEDVLNQIDNLEETYNDYEELYNSLTSILTNSGIDIDSYINQQLDIEDLLGYSIEDIYILDGNITFYNLDMQEISMPENSDVNGGE